MHADSTEINPYLQQEVLSASPPRLRWLLVKRAEDLCSMIAQMWAEGQVEQAGQWIIRVRDILGELLSGVQDASNPVSQHVADFYVFLLQVLGDAEQTRNAERISVLRELLSIEAETWRLVMEKDTEVEATPMGPATAGTVPMANETPIYVPSLDSSLESSGGFSLEI